MIFRCYRQPLPPKLNSSRSGSGMNFTREFGRIPIYSLKSGSLYVSLVIKIQWYSSQPRQPSNWFRRDSILLLFLLLPELRFDKYQINVKQLLEDLSG